MRPATCVLILMCLCAPARATEGEGVTLTPTSVDEQPHAIRVGVNDRAGEVVFSVTVAAKNPKVPLEVVQGYLSVYAGDRRIVGCWVEARREKETVSYEFAVAPTHLARSRFSFSAATATVAERKLVPSGSGWINYTLPLQEFAGDGKLKPPELEFAGVESRGTTTHLLFDVTNPNPDPVPYLGYNADAFDPRLPTGTIAPLYEVECRTGGVWKADPLGWCGFGIGPVSVVNGRKDRIDVPVYRKEWEEVRVGLVWHPGGKWVKRTAWSKAIRRADVFGK